MKKLYNAPALEFLAFVPAYNISNDDDFYYGDGSQGWNDGELGWT